MTVKVSLVEPKVPFLNFYTAYIKHLPLMGPLYLGAILSREGHDVRIFNENIRKLDYSHLKDSDVLGISIVTSTAPRGYEIARQFRLVNPKGRIIIGGAHATFMPDEASQYADHVVRGEAEGVIADVVKNGSDSVVEGSPVQDLDALPFPDFSMMAGFGRYITPISTSRGCPHNCVFCSVTPMFGRKYRFRSTESIVEEISRFKHHHIFFYDDNFAANKNRAKELLRAMIEHKLTPRWTAQAAVDVADDEDLLELIAKANCGRLCIGFESMDADTLRSYNKKQTPDDVIRCLGLLKKHHIKVHGMFISDGYSDIYNKLGIDSLQLSVLIPLVGSKLYKSAKDAGSFIFDKYPTDWELFDGIHVVHRPDSVSPVEMQKQTIEALKHFYSRFEVAKLFFTAKFGDCFMRAMGHRMIRKWESQNKDFMSRLKGVTSSAASDMEPFPGT